MPINCSNIPEDWLIFQILSLVNCRIALTEIALFSHIGNKMTIAEFVKEYEKTDNLILYFCKPNFGSFHGKIFGDMKYIGKLAQNTCEKLREQDLSHNFFINDSQIPMEDAEPALVLPAGGRRRGRSRGDGFEQSLRPDPRAGGGPRAVLAGGAGGDDEPQLHGLMCAGAPR